MPVEFDEWYTLTRASLGPPLRAWCGDEELATEALDEAFVRAVERWHRVGGLTSPSGWVWRTATNVARRRERRRRLEDQLLRRRANDRRNDRVNESRDIDLQRALLALTERQRAAIVLYYLADLPVSDVAAVMGVASGTVEATLHQARQRLNRALNDDTVPTPHPARDGAAS
jgi:RNA polymerase sigma-70 factor (ECF subfamily)